MDVNGRFATWKKALVHIKQKNKRAPDCPEHFEVGKIHFLFPEIGPRVLGFPVISLVNMPIKLSWLSHVSLRNI
jgi:hypothetical protein